MSVANFLWDKTLSIVFNAAGIIAVGVFAGVTAGAAVAAPVAVAWALFAAVYYTVSYILLKKRVTRLRKIAAETEDKFILGEVVSEPPRTEDRLYYELMVLQGRAAIERVFRAEKEKAEYYDYIQEWVHEVKIPLTAIALICGRNTGEDFRELARQAEKIGNYTEQVLYEAKSNVTEKDMLIRETELDRVVNDCIRENKRLFIDAGLAIETDVSGVVYTDEKWLGFILKQILQNCCQYRAADSAVVRIAAAVLPGEKLELSVWDNGVGILESDLPRVFDKGFTGSNGRRNKRSTGLGLYLCKKLCAALDVEISARSVRGEFTRIALVFNVPALKNANLTKP